MQNSAFRRLGGEIVSDVSDVSDTRTQSARSSRSDGYASGRTTKSSIVERAAEAFAQSGFHGASMRSIARAAGVDHSTLIHHFGNKTNLLLAVLEWHDMQHLPAGMPATFNPEEITLNPAELAGMLVAVAERNARAPGLVRLLGMLSAEAASEDHPARAALQARHQALRGVLASAIRTQRENASAPVTADPGSEAPEGKGPTAQEGDLSPEATAALIIATWDGLQSYDALHPGEIDVPTMLAHVLRPALGLA